MVEKSELASTPQEWWSQFYRPIRQFGERVAELFSPSSEASAAEDYYEITVELPGVAESDISVEVHDRRLTISGEKKAAREEKGKNYYFSERVYGAFSRAFQLPVDADVEKIMATHKDGLLTVKIAKTRPEKAKAKKIEISRS